MKHLNWNGKGKASNNPHIFTTTEPTYFIDFYGRERQVEVGSTIKQFETNNKGWNVWHTPEGVMHISDILWTSQMAKAEHLLQDTCYIIIKGDRLQAEATMKAAAIPFSFKEYLSTWNETLGTVPLQYEEQIRSLYNQSDERKPGRFPPGTILSWSSPVFATA